MNQRIPYRIAILAMGGQGGGVLTNWLVALAENNDYVAQASSVPGVAQRTGATLYYVEIIKKEGDKKPVLSLMPFEEEVDLVVAAELMEGARALQRGLITPDKTTTIISSHRVFSVAEKISKTDGAVDSQKLIEPVQKSSKKSIFFDMNEIAESNKGVISAALFGAIAGSNVLPFPKEQYESIIEQGGKAVETNLKIFNLGYDLANAQAQSLPVLSRKIANAEINPSITQKITHLNSDVQSIIAHGYNLCLEYQNKKYAEKYMDYLKDYLNKDNDNKEYEYFLLEFARYLALFMCYEDLIRVAQLKVSKQRSDEIINSFQAQNKVFFVEDYFHPRYQEIADILPNSSGNWLMNSPKIAKYIDSIFGGKKKLSVNKLSGFFQLKIVSSLRFMRPSSYRFNKEQQAMNKWFEQVNFLLEQDVNLARYFVTARRIIKGYSGTYERSVQMYALFDELIDNYIKDEENKPNLQATKLADIVELALNQEKNEVKSKLKEIYG